MLLMTIILHIDEADRVDTEGAFKHIGHALLHLLIRSQSQLTLQHVSKQSEPREMLGIVIYNC